MLSQFPEDITLKIWHLLPLKDRLNLVLLNKECKNTFTVYLYRNLFLNDRRVLTLGIQEYPKNGVHFSEYSFLKFDANDSNSTHRYMKILIDTLQQQPEYLPYIENVRNSWRLDIDLKLELLNLLIYGKTKDGVLYKAFNLRSFENNLNFQIFTKLISSNYPVVSSKFNALDIPFITRLPVTDEYKDEIDFNGYFGKVSDVFDKFAFTFSNLRSLTIHFNPLVMKFCNNKKLQLKYLCLNIREKEYNDSMGYLNKNNAHNSWSDFLEVDYLRELELVSWLPNPQVVYLKDFALVDLVRKAQNLNTLKLYSFPYFPELMEVILNETESLKELRLDLFDLSQVFTRFFMEKHSAPEKYSNLCHLEKFHIELVTTSYKDPDFLIYLLRDHPQFSNLRSKIPCPCEECVNTISTLLSNKLFHKPPFLEYDSENRSIKSYSLLYLLFKEIMYVMPHKSSFENLFVQYGIINVEQLKHHINSLYSTDLTLDDLDQIYRFILHFYKRGITFMLTNFPKLQYLNLNDLPVVRTKTAPGFSPCFSFSDLV